MKSLFEIIRLEWRSLIRTRTFAMLLVGVVAWMLAVPFLIKSDGTESGTFQLAVRYSLGVVLSVSVVALTASAASSISKERAAKRLQLSLVRPVRRFSLAFGRMVAIVSAGAAIFAVACVILWLQIGRGRTCAHRLSPVMESPEVATQRLFEEYMAKYPDFREKVGKNGEHDVRLFLRQYVMSAFENVATNSTASWNFDIGLFPTDAPFAVRVRLTDMYGRLEQVEGTFRLGNYSGELSHVNRTTVTVPLRPAIEGEALQSDGKLVFENRGKLGVNLNPRHDIDLMIGADSFAWNIFRAWIELVAILSTVVALGVFLGACFGRSVALFAAMSLLFVMVVSPAVMEDYPDPTEASRLDRIAIRLSEISARCASPFNVYSPISALSENVCVEKAEAFEAVRNNMFLIPILLSLIAGLVMGRKAEDA